MNVDRRFLADKPNEGNTDAKFNLFRFQDHLVEQIAHIADYFRDREYASAFEALQTIYIDTNGFYSEKEKEQIQPAYLKARSEYLKFLNGNSSSSRMVNIPIMDLYMALIDFKMVLMKYLAIHQFLIPTIRKSSAGATSAM